MGYNLSKYNFFFDAEDGTRMAFNAMRGGLAIIEEENYEEIQRILADPNGYMPDTEEKKKLWDSLLKGGFIIEEDVDELEALKVRNRVRRFNTDTFSLTIMPTLQCNFRCIYCYESFPDLSMTPEIEEGIIRWVREKTRFVRAFHVGWFGGEPLMRFDVMKRLGEEFKRLSEEREFRYSMSITTNGYLMDERKIRWLADVGLQNVQVTLDGPPETHDKRRVLTNGKGSFGRILENVITLNRVAPEVKVTIRVNFDKTNIEDVPRLFEIFPESLKNQARIYFRHVYTYHRTWKEVKCQPLTDPSQEISRLSKEALRHGFRLRPLERSKAAYCYADYMNNMVVGPDGNLYKCTVAMAPQDRVGYITPEGKVKAFSLLTRWMALDPFEDEECRSCNLTLLN